MLALTGCSQGASTAASSSTTADGGCPLAISDAWVKAADSGMTAAFGTLENTSDQTVTVDSATSPAASMLELHEVVTGTDGSATMQPKSGGFVIDAGATQTLEPGGEHLMFMDVTAPIEAGDEVTVTLHTTAGATCVMQASARTYDGGNETYAPSTDASSQSPMAEMDMSTP